MAAVVNRARIGYWLAFLISLLTFVVVCAPAWLMARLVSSLSDDKVRLQQLSGGLWNGRAESVLVAAADGSPQRLENLSWQTSPARLLRGEIAVHFALADRQVTGQGMVRLGGGETAISGLRASLPAGLAGAFAPALALWKPAGTFHIDADEVRLNPLRLAKAATLAWSGATLGLFHLPAPGDYRLVLTPADNKVGLDLRTINGALLISGSGLYTPKVGGELRATARAAAGFADALAPLLNVMGPANGDGSVSFALPLQPLQ